MVSWLTRGLTIALVLMAAPREVPAQQKPIKIVYPFPAGSAGDTVSRIVAAGLQTKLNRTVLVENRAGAGGITGTRSVATSEADGTTLIVIPSAVATMIPLYNADAGYNVEKDFVPLSQLVSQDLPLASARPCPWPPSGI